MASRRKRSPVGGGGARHPNSLANLRRGGTVAPQGNRYRVTHGAYAELALESIEEKAAQIVAALHEDVPVDGPWGVPIRLLAETLLRLDGVTDYLRRRGWEDDDGNPRTAVDLEGRLHDRALGLAKELGLTPLAASKLGVNVARTRQAGLAGVMDGGVIDR